MATATQIATTRPSSVTNPRREYACQCGHVLHVVGGGRHSMFFEPGAADLDDPILNRACPECGRGLPGKGQPYAVPDLDGAERRRP